MEEQAKFRELTRREEEWEAFRARWSVELATRAHGRCISKHPPLPVLCWVCVKACAPPLAAARWAGFGGSGDW